MLTELPNDTLTTVFLYLNAAESIASRGVCHRWSQTAGRGCMTLQLRSSTTYRNDSPKSQIPTNIGSVTLVGRRSQKTTIVRNRDDDEDDEKSPVAPLRRVRGHLPQPATLSRDKNSTTTAITFATDRLRDFDVDGPHNNGPRNRMRSEAIESGRILSLTTARCDGFGGAIRVEDISSLSSHLITLDFGSTSSTFEYCRRAQTGRGEPNFDEIIKTKKPRLLKSSLVELDVSALRFLEKLSVRGCGNLESLSLPPSIRTLDAGFCSNLIRVDFPNGADGSLAALDLGGCRMLRQREYRIFCPRPGLLGPDTKAALKNIINIDLSHVCQIKALDAVFCNALLSTVCIETFSLRYGATDEVIMALAKSESAFSGKLRLVDIAFSSKVTDKAVELLAKNSSSLERLNMRGCKKITVSCYNQIPIYLERRRCRKEDDAVLEKDRSFRSCTRKGDNLFYFCQKEK